MKILLSFFLFSLILLSFHRTGYAGTCKPEDSASRNWEVSAGFSLAGARGNTDKTDIGARLCYEFDDAEHRLTSRSNYRFGKVDRTTNEDFWDSTLFYLHRIYNSGDKNKTHGDTSVFLSLGSFAERDEIEQISLKYGFGGGFAADFLLSLFVVKTSVDVFWEREDGVSTPTEDFISLRSGLRLEKDIENIKTSAATVFIFPFNEKDDFRSESEFLLEVPVYGNFSLRLSANVDYDNRPIDKSVKKTEFRYMTSLNFAF